MSQKFKLSLGFLAVAVIGLIGGGQIGLFSGRKPVEIRDRLLVEVTCPVKSENCVATTDPVNSYKSVKPLPFKAGSLPLHVDLIKRIMKFQYQSEPTQQSDRYLHFEVHSKLMGFVDDVEFFFSEEDKLIHLRSASRLGRKDFSVNYKRVLNIEFHYVQTQLE